MKQKAIKSSGNVFVNLDFENADKLHIKADLTAVPRDAIQNQ